MSAFLRTETFLGSAEVPEICFSHDAEDEAASNGSRIPQRVLSPLPARPRSLADELEKDEERNSTGQHVNGFQNRTTTTTTAVATRNGNQLNLDESLESVGGAESTEEEWFAEEDNLFEEMLGVEPLVRTEVDLLQKEKATWESDQDQLRKEKRELREQKEAFERYLHMNDAQQAMSWWHSNVALSYTCRKCCTVNMSEASPLPRLMFFATHYVGLHSPSALALS